uniref:Kelch-like protein 2 n=1 Tax=Phallusia mammillata TaxID=59560 RepID=A0A6F9DG77_9ASCI|nr:kelch-like protein 2 [Phallusia mammillata]
MTAVIKLRNNGCEEAVFTAILKWVNHNPLQREEFFANLFLQIDLSLTSTQFLTEASKESLVRNNVVCSNYLVDKLLKIQLDSSTGGEISSSVQGSDLPTYSSFASPSQPNPELSPKYLQNSPTPSTYYPTSSYTDKLLIVGGQESSADCIVYDVITKQKTYLPELNHGRSGATSVKVGSKIFVFGGGDGVLIDACEMLDLNEPNRWHLMSSLLPAREHCSSSHFEGHIYVTGGWNNGRLSYCEKFDIHNNKWIKMKNMNIPRDEHGTVVCNGFLYCIGGSQRSKRLSSCERYDMRSDVWSEIAPLNQARKGLACVVLDGNIYAIGGNGGGKTVERFNPTIGRWAYVASLQYARYHSSACVVGNKIFVVGGSSGEESRNSVQVYDSTADVWTTAFKTQKPVCEATVVAI